MRAPKLVRVGSPINRQIALIAHFADGQSQLSIYVPLRDDLLNENTNAIHVAACIGCSRATTRAKVLTYPRCEVIYRRFAVRVCCK